MTIHRTFRVLLPTYLLPIKYCDEPKRADLLRALSDAMSPISTLITAKSPDGQSAIK